MFNRKKKRIKQLENEVEFWKEMHLNQQVINRTLNNAVIDLLSAAQKQMQKQIIPINMN